MNTDRIRTLAPILIAVVLVALFGWWSVQKFYVTPRDEKLAEIASLQTTLNNIEGYHDRGIGYRRDLQSYADKTLGSTDESVDHAFRARLNRITEELKLANVVVSTGRSSAQKTPARKPFSKGTEMRRLREQIDFVEKEGSVSAEGTLDQVVRLADRIVAEPWMKRIDSVVVSPKGNGERFGLTVRMTTLYLPGLEPEAQEEQPYDSARMDRFASIVSANPFRVPPPPAPPVQVTAKPEPDPPSQPAAPPAFPYHKWGMTAVAESIDSFEVWIRNSENGEQRQLLVGQKIGKAVLVEANGEFAWFEEDETRFKVVVGSRLSDRLPPG